MAVVGSAFDDILDEAGMDIECKTFLKARGITSVAILSYVCSSEQEVHDKLGMPFINGTRIGGTDYKLQGVEDVWLAVVKYTLSRCRQTTLTTLTQNTTATTTTTDTTATTTTKTPSHHTERTRKSFPSQDVGRSREDTSTHVERTHTNQDVYTNSLRRNCTGTKLHGTGRD